jgi:hypothetical protein
MGVLHTLPLIRVPDSYWDKIRQDKDAFRERLAALSVDEKLLLVERLRERAQAMRGTTSPASAYHRAAVSNVHVASSFEGHVNVSGANIRVGVIGANASLIAFAVSPANRATSGKNSDGTK